MASPEHEKHPELSDAVLGADELTALFRDYRDCVTLQGVVVRAGRGEVRDRSRSDLNEIHMLLAKRQIGGAQIRYEFDGRTWCDTLMPVEGGVRLVRIEQQ